MSEFSNAKKDIAVFFSYSHKDEDLRDELSNHLVMLKRQQVITVWHDRRIGAGKEWKQEIDEHLKTADLILLLISSDFLASDYCYDIELKQAMERHHAGEARVIPIILRPVDWQYAPFGKLQALPLNARPVVDWPNRDEAFLNIAQGIRAAAEELAIDQVRRLVSSLEKVEKMRNWPNVISLGERILKSLPEHLPESRTIRHKTAAAYVKRWSRCFNQQIMDIVGVVTIKTKRKESESEIREQILIDLNRAIELDPENGEYYFLRYSVSLIEADRDRAFKLDPAIAKGLEENKEAAMNRFKKPEFPTFSLGDFNFKDLMGDIERRIKEPWRLKCLRD